MGEENNGEPSNIRDRHPTCAPCKHQRRKCPADCVMAPYFSSKNMEEFDTVHKIFGVSNIAKKLKSLDAQQRYGAVSSIKWEASEWDRDPILGPLGLFERLRSENEVLNKQLEELKKQQELLLSKEFERLKEQCELLETLHIDSPIAGNGVGPHDLIVSHETQSQYNGPDNHNQLTGNGTTRGESNGTRSNIGNFVLHHQMVSPQTEFQYNDPDNQISDNGTTRGESSSTSYINGNFGLHDQMVSPGSQIQDNGPDNQISGYRTTRGESNDNTSYNNGNFGLHDQMVNPGTQFQYNGLDNQMACNSTARGENNGSTSYIRRYFQPRHHPTLQALAQHGGPWQCDPNVQEQSERCGQFQGGYGDGLGNNSNQGRMTNGRDRGVRVQNPIINGAGGQGGILNQVGGGFDNQLHRPANAFAPSPTVQLERQMFSPHDCLGPVGALLQPYLVRRKYSGQFDHLWHME